MLTVIIRTRGGGYHSHVDRSLEAAAVQMEVYWADENTGRLRQVFDNL